MLIKFVVIFFICVIVNQSYAQIRLDPLVDTEVGLIRGLKSSDGNYSMFLGIPYAKINETNPFGPSIPHEIFNATFDAYDDSAICPQIEEFNNTIVGSLDCLHLNIYVPSVANSKNLLPILVWIYGGGFRIGFAGRYLYGPKYLIRHDVILITLNYRVGPYGFMCLDKPDIPGNQGFKDQLMGLKWIKDNIRFFGGNPNMITLFGESAGAVAIDYLLVQQREELLFNNIILQSGTSLLPLLVSKPEESKTLQLAQRLGFTTENVDEALGFLRNIDTKLVIGAAAHIDRFLPCVENDFDGVERLISDYTHNLNVFNARNIAILIGHNNDEKFAEHANKDSEYFKNLNIFENKLKNEFNFNSTYLHNMVNYFKHFYIGDENISKHDETKITDFDSDFTYNHPTQRSIKKYLENNADKIFYYVFSYNGERNFVKKRLNITNGGAVHADEIGYLFDISYMTEIPNAQDQLIIDQMTSLWTNFVKYRNPTPNASELLPVIWKSVEKCSLNYMEINSELELKKRPFNKRMSFWDLFYKYNNSLKKNI